MITYPGLPGPAISTYVDAPYHFHADGVDVAKLPLERLVNVPVVVIRASGRAAIGPEVLDDAGALLAQAVLVNTGWSRHWRDLTEPGTLPSATTRRWRDLLARLISPSCPRRGLVNLLRMCQRWQLWPRNCHLRHLFTLR